MISDMMDAAMKMQVSYVEQGLATPHLEFVMHPKALMQLQWETDRDSSSFLNRRTGDGKFEFMNHVIREDINQDGWKLQPVDAT